MRNRREPHVVIIGAGFCGLTAAFELSKSGIRVTVLERDNKIGGLAGSFTVGGVQLEKFYHHWFRNDKYAINLAREVKAQDRIVFKRTTTGIYCSNKFFKISNPLDLSRFKPLRLIDRLRFGLLVPRVQIIKNWRKLEDQKAKEWLMKMIGKDAYELLWGPLFRGKFGEFAPEISAVWVWNKLKLRGGSRGKGGQEELAYYRGSFAEFANRIKEHIESREGQVITNFEVEEVIVADETVTGLRSGEKIIHADAVIATPALPAIAKLLKGHVSPDYVRRLRKIRYLGNICLVLQLNHRLSDYYWLNVGDLEFPFVGIIEHTNFQSAEAYGGNHIVYLTKYLSTSDPLFSMKPQEILNHTIPYLRKMFPTFHPSWIIDYHLWKAHYSQPVVECKYSHLIPEVETPIKGFYIATMAQVYPEDRGINYAIRQGRAIARHVAKKLLGS